MDLRTTLVESEVTLDAVCIASDDLVVREIEGELIIVPLVSGIGDMEDELYSLNDTGRAIWEKLDGKKKLRDVVAELLAEFEASPGEIERDVLGLAEELLKRKMIVET
jgi:hypothetical protein